MLYVWVGDVIGHCLDGDIDLWLNFTLTAISLKAFGISHAPQEPSSLLVCVYLLLLQFNHPSLLIGVKFLLSLCLREIELLIELRILLLLSHLRHHLQSNQFSQSATRRTPSQARCHPTLRVRAFSVGTPSSCSWVVDEEILQVHIDSRIIVVYHTYSRTLVATAPSLHTLKALLLSLSGGLLAYSNVLKCGCGCLAMMRLRLSLRCIGSDLGSAPLTLNSVQIIIGSEDGVCRYSIRVPLGGCSRLE